MPLTQEEQFEKLILRSDRILILLPENPTGDHIGAGWGLTHFLTNHGKTATVAYSDPHHHADAFNFLIPPENTVHSLRSTRDFVLTFKTKRNNISNIRTEHGDDNVAIYVTPERGMVDSRDFSFGLAPFPYDLLISLGASSKKALGSLATDAPDLFYDVPLVNVDVSPANEHHGQLNIVKLTASSVSEIIGGLCLAIDEEHLKEEVAASFLTGLISATNSFRQTQTTPRTLSLASDFIDRGANQQDIVTHLYKSQPLGLIKLWGRALANLIQSQDGTIISTTVSQADFTETETQPFVTTAIIEKVKENHTQGKVFVLIYEDEEIQHALIDATRYGTLPQHVFGSPSEKNLYLYTSAEKSSKAAESDVVEQLQTILSDK